MKQFIIVNMIEVESGMEDITVMDSSDFWEELKQKLEDEMTQNEQERVRLCYEYILNVITLIIYIRYIISFIFKQTKIYYTFFFS